jgi:hypothetical protein
MGHTGLCLLEFKETCITETTCFALELSPRTLVAQLALEFGVEGFHLQGKAIEVHIATF